MKIGERKHGHAKCMVSFCSALPEHMRQGVREISALETDPHHRGEGDATKLMKEICADADARRMILVLMVQPFGVLPRMSGPQLIAWYMTFGFQPLPNGTTTMLARMHAINIEVKKK